MEITCVVHVYLCYSIEHVLNQLAASEALKLDWYIGTLKTSHSRAILCGLYWLWLSGLQNS